MIPSSLVLDVNGQDYPDGVIPDEAMSVVYDARYGTQDDQLVQGALDWLEEEHGCSR